MPADPPSQTRGHPTLPYSHMTPTRHGHNKGDCYINTTPNATSQYHSAVPTHAGMHQQTPQPQSSRWCTAHSKAACDTTCRHNNSACALAPSTALLLPAAATKDLLLLLPPTDTHLLHADTRALMRTDAPRRLMHPHASRALHPFPAHSLLRALASPSSGLRVLRGHVPPTAPCRAR